MIDELVSISAVVSRYSKIRAVLIPSENKQHHIKFLSVCDWPKTPTFHTGSSWMGWTIPTGKFHIGMHVNLVKIITMIIAFAYWRFILASKSTGRQIGCRPWIKPETTWHPLRSIVLMLVIRWESFTFLSPFNVERVIAMNSWKSTLHACMPAIFLALLMSDIWIDQTVWVLCDMHHAMNLLKGLIVEVFYKNPIVFHLGAWV